MAVRIIPFDRSLRIGECAETEPLTRVSHRTDPHGMAGDKNARTTEGDLYFVVGSLGEYAEAETPGRGSLALEKMLRALGRDHHQTLVTPSHLATSLPGQDKYVEAMEIHRENLAPMTRLLGAERKAMLVAASNRRSRSRGEAKRRDVSRSSGAH